MINRNTVQIFADNKYKPKSWWSEETMRLFRLRMATRAKYYKTRTLNDLIAFPEAEDALLVDIKQRKRESFASLIN